jgi:hypothetical protein
MAQQIYDQDMDTSNLLQTLAVLVEFTIAVLGVLIAIQNKKTYGWFIAATFSLYVLFDIYRIFALPLSADLQGFIFFIACCLMMCAAWLLYNEK